MTRKHLYLTLDTETCGSLSSPLVYDLGFVIHDREGQIYEKRSYVIREIFFGEYKKMKTCYYRNKLPEYYRGMQSGKWNVASFWSIRKEIFSLMKEYKIKAVIAYNAAFDIRALNSTLNHLSKFEEKQTFFNESTKVWDSWGMACETILQKKNFFRNAIENEWMSKAGNVQTSAEVAYRNISKDKDFIEAHTALEDAIIETAIFAQCNKMKKKMTREIMSMPWKIPQPPFKEYFEKVSGF